MINDERDPLSGLLVPIAELGPRAPGASGVPTFASSCQFSCHFRCGRRCCCLRPSQLVEDGCRGE